MPNNTQYPISKPHIFDLEDRTKEFASNCREFIKSLQYSTANNEDSKQLARSSGSVAANYIEANERLSKLDFKYRIKICRKEAKESRLWLELVECKTQEQENQRANLIGESTQLLKIFSSIIERSN